MSNIMIVTKRGMIIKFDSLDAPTQKRGGLGIKGITLKDGDEVVSMISVKK